MAWLKVALVSIAAFVMFDVLIARPILHLGYPTHYGQDEDSRSPAPYITFTGRPSPPNMDKWGYRWVHLPSSAGEITVSFFGGSTGVGGDPPIPSLLESELSKRLNRKVAISNFSVVSANHRQNLHNIIESRSIVKPDLVIFYGGYNETIQSAYYDPRPGYPYNFFYREETSDLVKVLLRYSAFVGLLEVALDRRLHVSFTPIDKLREAYKPLSPAWNRAIVDKYFETLDEANTIASAFPSAHCGRAKFIGFYQPYQRQIVPQFAAAHAAIRQQITKTPYMVDVSDGFDDMGPSIYEDIVHVKQPGNVRMASLIADAIVRRGVLAGCRP